MHRYFLFVILSLQSNLSFSQDLLHKAFAWGEYNLVPQKHIPLDNGSFLLIASTQEAAFLIRTDASGNIQWGKRIGQGTVINDALMLPGNDIILAGSTNSNLQYELYDMLLMRISGAGELKWSRTYYGNDGETAKLLAFHQNTLFVAGQADSYRAMPSRIFLMRVDSGGNIISEDNRFEKNMETLTGMAIFHNTLYFSATGNFTTGRDPMLISADMTGRFRDFISFPMEGDNISTGIAASPSGLVISAQDRGQGAERLLLIDYKEGDLVPPSANLVNIYSDDGGLFAKIIAVDSGYFAYGVLDSQHPLLMKLNSDLVSVSASAFYPQTGSAGFTSLSLRAGNMLTGAGYIHLGAHFNRVLFFNQEDTETGPCGETVRVYHARENSIAMAQVAQLPCSVSLSTFQVTLPYEDAVFTDTLLCSRDPENFNVSDTVLCAGSAVTVSGAPSGALEYLWQFEGGSPSTFSGRYPPEIRFTQPGSFKLSLLTRRSGGWDTLQRVIKVFHMPVAHAGNDTLVCGSAAIRLHASGGAFYKWTADATLDRDDVPNPLAYLADTRKYFVTVSDSGFCSSVDSVTITVLHAPDITQGFDTLICPFDALLLNAGNPGFAYRWNNGDTRQRITPHEAGDYSVKISNQCFSASMDFRISYKDCSPTYFIPSAFTPDGDGLNDVFTASGEYMSVVKMKIFNRWGQKLFEAEGKNISWDGSYNGKKCEGGVYIYLMEIKGVNSQVYYPTGTVHLLE